MPTSPSAELVPPQPYQPIPNLVENILGAAQYISPSYWLGWVAEQATGTDPWMWVAEQFAGDYEAAQKAGLALKNLGEFNSAYASRIDSLASGTIPFDWNGNAATSAQEYFSELAQALRDQISALNAVGSEFETMAFGVYQTAQSFAGFFQTMVDYLIAAAAKAAAAAATAKTIIGGIAFGGASAYSIWQATQAWRTALSIHDAAWTSVQAFSGVVAGYLGGLDGLNKVALPSGSYSHPGV